MATSILITVSFCLIGGQLLEWHNEFKQSTLHWVINCFLFACGTVLYVSLIILWFASGSILEFAIVEFVNKKPDMQFNIVMILSAVWLGLTLFLILMGLPVVRLIKDTVIDQIVGKELISYELGEVNERMKRLLAEKSNLEKENHLLKLQIELQKTKPRHEVRTSGIDMCKSAKLIPVQ